MTASVAGGDVDCVEFLLTTITEHSHTSRHQSDLMCDGNRHQRPARFNDLSITHVDCLKHGTRRRHRDA